MAAAANLNCNVMYNDFGMNHHVNAKQKRNYGYLDFRRHCWVLNLSCKICTKFGGDWSNT